MYGSTDFNGSHSVPSGRCHKVKWYAYSPSWPGPTLPAQGVNALYTAVLKVITEDKPCPAPSGGGGS